MALFFVFPRINGEIFSLPANTSQGSIGLSENLKPGDIAKLVEDNTVVFRATTKLRSPDTLYWRVFSLGHNKGFEWNKFIRQLPYNENVFNKTIY